MIVTKNLSKRYKMGKILVKALEDVNIEIERGEFVGIVGPSGCGKTTLLNLLGGLDRQSHGKIIIDGIDLSRLNDRELSRYRREKVGIVLQFFNLIPILTALENVTLPLFLALITKMQKKGLMNF
jgi:putative ABC transport system ATP-binding protein